LVRSPDWGISSTKSSAMSAHAASMSFASIARTNSSTISRFERWPIGRV